MAEKTNEPIFEKVNASLHMIAWNWKRRLQVCLNTSHFFHSLSLSPLSLPYSPSFFSFFLLQIFIPSRLALFPLLSLFGSQVLADEAKQRQEEEEAAAKLQNHHHHHHKSDKKDKKDNKDKKEDKKDKKDKKSGGGSHHTHHHKRAKSIDTDAIVPGEDDSTVISFVSPCLYCFFFCFFFFSFFLPFVLVAPYL